MKLDKRDNNPLYEQLYNILKQNIDDGVWREGDVIPGENDLAKTFDVSRVTVRKAVSKLAADDYVTRRRGLGTIVYQNRSSLSNFTLIRSSTHEMKEMGRPIKTMHASLTHINPSPSLIKLFNLKPGEKLYNLKRLRGYNGQPLLFSDTYLYPMTEIPDQPEVIYGTLNQFLTDHGVCFDYFEDTVSAVKPIPKLTNLLKINDDIPLLKRERLSYGAEHQLLEYTITHYNSTLYQTRNIIDYNKQK